MAWAEASRASAYYGLGNLQAGLERAASGLVMAEQNGENRLMAFIRSNRAIALADMGDYDAAQADADFVMAMAVETGFRQIYGWAYQSLGMFYVYCKDWDRLMEVYQASQEYGFQRQDFLIQAWLGKELSGQIHELMRDWSPEAAGGSPYQRALVWRLAGQCFLAWGDHLEALGLFDKSIAAFEAGETRLELAKALLDRSKVQQALGETEAACKDARQARDLFMDCGARPGAAEAAGWLEGLDCHARQD
jgi:tetratricopeptide (TPR) repeat protein